MPDVETAGEPLSPDTGREVPSLMGQCRWALECELDALQEVTVKSLGITTVACPRHAEEHNAWLARYAPETIAVLNPPPEPEPECWCPDPELLVDGERPAYCPAHGTPEQRGHEEGW